MLAFPNKARDCSIISDIGGRPRRGLLGFDLGVSEAGIGELSIVILGEEARFNGVGNSEEVALGLRVGQVHVEVVLEVLKHVHVLLDEGVSSDSWEGEGLIEEFPGVNVHLGFLAGISHLLGDVLGVGPVTGIKSSGEHVNLVVKLGLGLIKIDARGTELDESILNSGALGFDKVVLELDG